MILAAGESKRMGEPKLLLPFGNKTIIETVIANATSSKADGTLVVLGSGWERIEKKIKKFRVKITVNPNFKTGMLSSVHCGLKALPEDAQAFLVLLGDQPAVSTKVINEIIDAYKRTRKGIVLPVYRNDRGHPVVIDLKYRNEVEQLSPEVGLRSLVYNHPEDIQEVEVKTSSILQDIDNPEDYKKELSKNKM